MTVDLTISQERANIYSDLQDIERISLSGSCENIPASKLLFKYWEEAGVHLWKLGYWNDYYRCINIVLRVAKSLNKVVEEAQLLSDIGFIYMEWQNFEIAELYFEDSLQKYKLLNDVMCQCRLLRYLGELHHLWGHFKLSLKYYFTAWDIVNAQPLEVFNDDKWSFLKAQLPCHIGSVYLDLPQPKLEESYFQLNLSLERFHALGHKWRYYQPSPLLLLGKWHFIKGNHNKSRQYYREGIQVSEEMRRPDTKADLLLHMAKLAESEGNDEEALQLLNESVAIAGTENPILRNRAARFRERLLSNKNTF